MTQDSSTYWKKARTEVRAAGFDPDRAAQTNAVVTIASAYTNAHRCNNRVRQITDLLVELIGERGGTGLIVGAPAVSDALTQGTPTAGYSLVSRDVAADCFEIGHYAHHGDAMIVISTSGLRPVIVEMAMGAKKRNLPVIGILSVAHCRDAKPGHSSGKKLLDVADLVIDNQCPPGDCIVELPGLDWRTGPTSTVTGGMIMNMIRCGTAERLLAKGFKPTLLPSHQFVGNTSAQEQLERFYEAYRKSLKHLYE